MKLELLTNATVVDDAIRLLILLTKRIQNRLLKMIKKNQRGRIGQ
jgi:Mg/Co/Ni transporter MgtE